jgi:chemotaxis-related protein WspB
MLILTMNIGRERYGIDALLVTEVIPMIRLDQIPMVDKVIKGIFNYRGTPTPVIDLCHFFEQRDCKNNLGSRIIIIDCPQGKHSSRPIGLIAERVTETLKCTKQQLMSSGIKSANSPFLGKIYKHNNEIIQLIDSRNILPVSIAQQIFVDDQMDNPPHQQAPA